MHDQAHLRQVVARLAWAGSRLGLEFGFGFGFGFRASCSVVARRAAAEELLQLGQRPVGRPAALGLGARAAPQPVRSVRPGPPLDPALAPPLGASGLGRGPCVVGVAEAALGLGVGVGVELELGLG